MNRLGVFTGNIYAEDELPQIEECCVQISPDITEEELTILKIKNNRRCVNCHACPVSNKREANE